MPEPSASAPAGIDPRGPRFVATITSVLLITDLFLALIDFTTAAFWLLVVIAGLFLWAVVSPRTAPWAFIFRSFVRPRLGPPSELEDPRPPRFAQGIGLLVTGLGVILHLLGVPYAIEVAAGLAFVAAFLNAAFNYCAGCQIYLLLQRTGIVGRERHAA